MKEIHSVPATAVLDTARERHPPAEAPRLSAGRFEVRGPFLFRDGAKFCAKGVTYGPFRPNAAGEFLPEPAKACADLDLLQRLGVNAVRVYHPAPYWFADLAHDRGIAILSGVPWSEHVAGFGDPRFQKDVRHRVREAAASLRGHPAILGHLVGNEIPAGNVRWARPEVVERFLADLKDVAKEADPGVLVSYANFPSTEYLSLEPFDFYTLNLYLHDRKAFRAYLSRMRNLAGHKPFILGELGIDAIREGEAGQASMVAASLEEAYRNGVAGAFVFSFTDEWFHRGHEVSGWAFGITDAERRPKPVAEAVKRVFAAAPEVPLEKTPPRMSVVVATYNGGSTLRETIESLRKLRYPDYEVIVIDDGSTDDSGKIAHEYTSGPRAIRLIQQPNRGLSAARNRGIEAATGEVVAFIDSDAAADEHWLYHLADALIRDPKLGGVGGPNLPPPGDGRVAAAVSASPGGPTHVLLDDVTAEHIPGCNMAFWKSALGEIRGFDVRHTSAGDDVDVCWRLQDRGLKLAYAPSAIVWHHRRNTCKGYLKQQRGYGEAESVLAFKHPGRYNALGGALWRGRIYSSGGGEGDPGLLAERRIHYGKFGKGLFQTIYQPGGPLLFELAATPEWPIVGALAVAAGAYWHSIILALFGVGLVACSLGVAVRLAVRARLEPRHDQLATRLLIFALSVAQPWVRRWGQVKSMRRLRREVADVEEMRAWWFGERDVDARSVVTRAFWNDWGGDRDAFLGELGRSLAADHFPVFEGDGFVPFDLEVGGDRGARVLVSSVMEHHDKGAGCLRVRVEPVLSSGARAALGIAAIASLALIELLPATSLIALFAVGLAWLNFRRRAVWLRRAVMARVSEAARKHSFTPIQIKRTRKHRDRLPPWIRRFLP